MIRVLSAVLVLLALQFVPGVGVADAQAGCTGNQCDTKEAAYAAAWANGNAKISQYCTGLYTLPASVWFNFNPNRNWEISTGVSCTPVAGGDMAFRGSSTTYQFPLANGGCPAGTSWNEASKTCYNEQACLSKPRLEGQTFLGQVMVDRLAFEGCEYVPSGDSVSLCLMDSDPPACISPTKWRPSGSPATFGDPAPTSTAEQSCATRSDGQTVCVKKDGRHCYSASTGRQICWRPGETGEKVDGPILQKRVGGVEMLQVEQVAPYGAMFEPASAGVKIMAEYGWFRDEGDGQAPTPATPSQMTTTTQNFSTTNNINAGGNKPDEGENADGTPGATPGNQGAGGQADGDGDDARWDVSGMPSEGPEGPPDSSGVWQPVGDGSALDESGFLGGSRLCPEPPSFELFGETHTIDTTGMCSLGEVIAALVLLMAFAQAAWIMGER